MAKVKFPTGPDPRKTNVRKVAVSTVVKPSRVARTSGKNAKRFGISNLKRASKEMVMT